MSSEAANLVIHSGDPRRYVGDYIDQLATREQAAERGLVPSGGNLQLIEGVRAAGDRPIRRERDLDTGRERRRDVSGRAE